VSEADSSNAVTTHKTLSYFEDYVLNAYQLAEEKL
jgi:hypothetical protein